MSTPLLPANCPLELEGGALEVTISTDSACIVLADASDGAAELEDLMLDGTEHTHHDGGFAINGRSIATHVPYDGAYQVTLVTEGPHTVGVILSLQHIADTMHDMDEHAEDGNGVEGAGQHHGNHHEGWSELQLIAITGNVTIFGDPAAILDHDEHLTLALRWPEDDGYLMFTSHAHDGFRDTLAFSWSAKV